MAAPKVRELVAHTRFTHHLCIQLLTPTSKPQITSSFERFELDASSLIPKKAVRGPSMWRLRLGRLNLQTPDRIASFSKYLHGINMRTIFAAAADASEEVDSSGLLPSKAGPSSFDSAPLRIDLIGLVSYHHPQRVRRLYVAPTDATHRLPYVWKFLQSSFTAAGFLLDAPRCDVKLVKIVTPKSWPSDQASETLASGPGVRATRDVKPVSFDARDLLEKYKDSVWAKDIRLERLSVFPIGTERGLPQGTMDPGVETDGVDLPQ